MNKTLLCMSLILAGCATPVVMLKHEATGQIARCGGGTAGSIAGGYVGYSFEESADRACVQDFEARGFTRLGTTAEPKGTGASASPKALEPRTTPSLIASHTGKDAYVAERLARQLKCTDTTPATLVGKGAGYESYSMACTNGETLLIRCEFGTCRALR